jgi:hypothetical protein
MKNFIAVLASLIFSVFSGLSPALPKSEPFSDGAVYQFDDSEPVNYKKLYEAFAGIAYDGSADCDTDPVYPALSAKPSGAENKSGRLWFQTDINAEEANFELKPRDGEQLIAPTSARLLTSPYSAKSAEGTLELLTGDGYTITYKNLKHWFCCARKQSESRAHSGELPEVGYVFTRGQLAGIAEPDTTITITKDKKNVTLREFYR